MGFNRFNINVVVLCILISITGIALVIVWTNPDYKIAKFTISILWIILIFILIRYVNKTNRSLKQFLENLRYNDFVADDISGKSFKELNFNFNEIIRYVRLAELEKESTHQYLRLILDQMPTGIMTLDNQGKIEIINRAGLDILELNSLSEIKSLYKLHNNLLGEFEKLRQTKKIVININTLGGLKSILFREKQVKINQRNIQIISFENIRTELDLEEEKTWQKIFRVLTHEIMNSIGPIRSLTASVLNIFVENNDSKKIEQLNNEDINVAVTGLKSIDNRNQGLSNFVSDFKKMMRIPEPQLELIELNSFMDGVIPILKEICANKKAKLDYYTTKKTYFLRIDKEQISQVIINLVKNSTESIESKKTGTVLIQPYLNKDKIVISVSDNGKGIPKDILPEIFIPFFTTKKEGSGIGLSISRQILRKHNGDIRVISEHKKGSKFEIILPVKH